MTPISGWFNPTRLIGLTAYLFAFVCCVIAWIGLREIPLPRRLAAILAVLEAALFLDMAISGRWLLHDLLSDEAGARGLYAMRAGPQIAALSFLGACATVGMASALRRLRGRSGATLAACGGILSVWCWCVEVVSLHGVDRVLYQTVDGVMVVSLVWIACTLMTGVEVVWYMFDVRSHER